MKKERGCGGRWEGKERAGGRRWETGGKERVGGDGG